MGQLQVPMLWLGAKAVVKSNGNALASGNLKAGSIYTVRYNASSGNFILQGEGGEYGNATTADVRTGVTFGTEDGIRIGINIDKKWQSGYIERINRSTGSSVTISGLPFVPSIVIIKYVGYLITPYGLSLSCDDSSNVWRYIATDTSRRLYCASKPADNSFVITVGGSSDQYYLDVNWFAIE